MTAEEKQQAFVQAAQEKRYAMYRVALSMLHQPSDAEDAVSEALETTWSHLPLIREAGALPAYMMRCTVNACHAQLRQRKRETIPEDMEAYMPAKSEGSPLWEYLDNLPEKFRLPLLMHYGEEMRIEEIAKALGLRRGTVSSRISRGLDLLRKVINEEESEA